MTKLTILVLYMLSICCKYCNDTMWWYILNVVYATLHLYARNIWP